ncbi:hypothetical protein NMY22_g10720 [Coprinellus aureogranulatus]|nr:hypothetical protein NMY22_g10720 [Coprinellus aureogranulatus]
MLPDSSNASLTKELSCGYRISILFIVEAAVVDSLSGVAIVWLLGYIIYRAIRRARTPGRIAQVDACDSSLFLSLLLGEALRAIGKLMSIKWLLEGAIDAPTPFCAAQGVVQLLATNIIDWSTLAISIQTMVILITPWRAPRHFAKYLVLGVWAVVSLIVGSTLGVHGLEMFEPQIFSCWYKFDLNLALFLSEYLWMWIIWFVMMILYVTNALVIRGSVEKDGWRIRWVSRSRANHDVQVVENQEELAQRQVEAQEEFERKQAALQLFLYPVVYSITVFPFLVSELLGRYSLSSHPVSVPYQAGALVLSIFTLSGLFNVILYFKTRPGLFKGNDVIPPGLVDDALPPSTPQGDGSDKPIRVPGSHVQTISPKDLSARLSAVER